MSIQGTDQTLVLTGVTSGIGQKALDLISKKMKRKLIIGARDPSSVPSEIANSVRVLPLDLARLESVAEFCKAAKQIDKINGLVLNAGLSPKSLRKTEDGFDLAFQVNYLAHFALIKTLWTDLSDDAHIIITSSGTHDPEEKAPPPAPKHADARRLADPNADTDRDRSEAKAASRSYTASKLCCTMLCFGTGDQAAKGNFNCI